MNRRWTFLLALGLLTVWISPFRRELFAGDETRYARVVHEMSAGGDLLVPHLGGEPWTHKPPLHFWLLLGLGSMLGRDTIWTFVLPSLLSFVALIWLTARAALRIAGAGTGLVSAALFSTFWLGWISAQTARMDLLFALLITAGALALFDSFENARARPLLLSGLCFGLAVLVKGPVAIAVAIVLYGSERFLRGRFEEPEGARMPAVLLALGIMLAVPLLWLVPAIVSGGPSYGEEVLIRQSLERAFGAWAHAEPPWFYLVRFPLTFFPWFLLTILGAWIALGRVQPSEKRRLRFLLSWFGSILVPLSLISGKLDVYMIPALVPAAILGAVYVEKSEAGEPLPGAGSRWITAILGLLLLTAAASAPALSRADDDLLILADPRVRALLWASGFLAAIAALVQWGRRSRGLSTVALGVAALSPLVGLVVFLMPVLNERASTVALVEALARTGARGPEIGLYWTPYLWAREMPAGLNRVRYEDPDELLAAPPEIVAVRSSHADDLEELLASYVEVEQVEVLGKEIRVFRRR